MCPLSVQVEPGNRQCTPVPVNLATTHHGGGCEDARREGVRLERLLQPLQPGGVDGVGLKAKGAHMAPLCPKVARKQLFGGVAEVQVRFVQLRVG